MKNDIETLNYKHNSEKARKKWAKENLTEEETRYWSSKSARQCYTALKKLERDNLLCSTL